MRTGPPEAFRPGHQPPETGAGTPHGAERAPFDPLRLCIYTTIVLIAWLITPPAAAVVFSAIGLRGYWRAHRQGLTRSRCLLGDTRLVLAYLAVVFMASSVAVVHTLVERFG